jgi:hypothetical protein
MSAQGTTSRPLGGLSGVRPGTLTNIVTATSTTWTVTPFLGLIDGEAAAIAGTYAYSFDSNQTGSVTAAAVSARIDRLDVQVSDPAESDGSSVPAIAIVYTAGTPGSGVPASAPARSHPLSQINVPASGGGSPTVTWSATYLCAPGGYVPFNTLGGLNLWTTAGQGQHATVINDVTANNGDYLWSGTAWIIIGGDTGWITPTLTNSWTSVAGQTIQYRRLNGFTVLRGQGTGGTSGSMFTLPAGFRTTQDRYYSVVAGTSTTVTTRVVVQIAGTVLPVTSNAPNLDQIVFPADA